MLGDRLAWRYGYLDVQWPLCTLREEADHILEIEVVIEIGSAGPRPTHCLNLDFIASIAKYATTDVDHLGIPAVDSFHLTAVMVDSPDLLVIDFNRNVEVCVGQTLDIENQEGCPTAATSSSAKRLFPELPRRGLKAIAGFFGHSVPKLKRSASHVAATIIIWRNMCKLLEDLYGVHTLDELNRWLKNTTASFRSGRAYPMDPKIRLSLPDQPGIYRMLRHNGDLLYIGKARSLKQRVNSYFQKHSRHAEHILEMLSQARDLEVIPTPTALEASLLESDEIKRCSPPYNIVLRQESRNLWFCSRDFRQFAFTTTESFCIGPLPSREMFTAFSAIGDLATIGCDDTTDSERFDAPAVLCIPEQYAPPNDIFQQGFRIFCQRYDDVLKKQSVWRGLMTIGTQLWRKYLEEMTMVGSGRESAVDHQILPEE